MGFFSCFGLTSQSLGFIANQENRKKRLITDGLLVDINDFDFNFFLPPSLPPYKTMQPHRVSIVKKEYFLGIEGETLVGQYIISGN